MARIGVVAIIITGSREPVPEVQKTLSEFADVIVARTGIPDFEHSIFTISVVVKGSAERISAFTGRLGRLSTVNVKSALTSVEVEEPSRSRDP